MPTICVGRDAELETLNALYRESASHGGRFATITGAQGVGKSCLLAELRRRMRLKGVAVFEGHCRPGARAYAPFIEIATEALNFLGDVTSASGYELSRLVGLLETMRGRNDGANAAAAWEDRRLAFFDAVRELFVKVAQVRPPLVLFHDVQWADGASLSLLRFLTQNLAPSPELSGLEDAPGFCGLWVISHREGTDTSDLFGASLVTRVTLGGLSREGVRQFLQAPPVVDWFLRATDGIPGAMESLFDARMRGAHAPLPTRGGELGDRVLAALSVLGHPVGPDALRRMIGAEERPLVESLAALFDERLIAKTVEAGELRVGFVRPADQLDFYNGLELEERRVLHAAAASLLDEQSGASGEDGPLEEIARHALEGALGERAVDFAMRAGERLTASFSYDRAAQLYEQAVAVTSRDDIRDILEERLLELAELAGDYPKALELGERLCARGRADAPLLRRMGRLDLLHADFVAADARLTRARALAIESGDRVTEALCLADVAETRYRAGHGVSAHTVSQEGLQLYAGDSALAAPRLSLANVIAKVLIDRGDYRAAIAQLAENRETAYAAGLQSEAARAEINLGIAHLRIGDYDEADARYRAALGLCQVLGDHRNLAIAQQNIAVLAHWRRDYATALVEYQRSVATFKRLGNREWLAWVAADLADLYLDLRDVERARAMTEFVARLAPTEGSPPSTRVALAYVRGRLATFEGRLLEARRTLQEALELEERAGIRRRRAWILYYLARVHAATADFGSAHEALGLLDEMPVGPTHVDAALLRCELHLREPGADLAPARRAVLRAMEISERFRDPEGNWRTRYWLARLAALGGAHAEAQRLYREAARAAETVCALVPEDLKAGYLADDLRLALSESLARLERAREAAVLVEEAPVAVSAEATLGLSPVEDEAMAFWRQKYPRIQGRSAKLRQVFAMLDKVAPHDSLVLIRGESGTGKELVAEAIHRHSARASKAFVKVNCGALVESLLLSELFGHERGAFTGALNRKKGRFELADGGTIFLDEIGDVSPKTQVALLRVLQEREFERVGGTAPIRIDVRIVCATNRDLEAMVRDGSFREDLYYRLKGLQVELPSLRERAEDVPLLAQCFLERIALERGAQPKRFDPSSQAVMMGYHWPGNIRELENLVRSVSLFADGLVIGTKDLGDYPELLARRVPDRVASAPNGDASNGRSDAFSRVVREGLSLKELKRQVEVECITQALREAEGNITRAAEILKMKRPRLSQLIKEYGIAV